MQRYFASFNQNNQVALSENDNHHFCHVMRGKKGDEIEVVIDKKLYLAEATNLNPLSFNIIKELKQDVELVKDLTLFFALAKGDKIDFVIQKATELGVKRIVLVATKRSVVKMNQEDFVRKEKRYQTIAKEASEQSHRLMIPEVLGIYEINKLPISLLAEINYVAFEGLAGTSKPDFSDINNFNSASLFIGPEGGFDDSEIETLTKLGFKTVSLGKRILRTETAAIYGLSVLGYIIEN